MDDKQIEKGFELVINNVKSPLEEAQILAIKHSKHSPCRKTKSQPSDK
jgi:hypothetical protein